MELQRESDAVVAVRPMVDRNDKVSAAAASTDSAARSAGNSHSADARIATSQSTVRCQPASP